MARPRTHHAAKKEELIKTAFDLFMKNGYENTSIQDIMNIAKISKGAMYHYFTCKEDILDAVLNYIIDFDEKRLKPVLEDQSLGSLDKLISVMNFRTSDPEEIQKANEYILQRKDSVFDYRARELSKERTIPKLTELIREGTANGEFHTDYPEEMAAFIYMSAQSVGEMMITKESDTSSLLRALEAFALLLANCLGLGRKEQNLLAAHLQSQMSAYQSFQPEIRRT